MWPERKPSVWHLALPAHGILWWQWLRVEENIPLRILKWKKKEREEKKTHPHTYGHSLSLKKWMFLCHDVTNGKVWRCYKMGILKWRISKNVSQPMSHTKQWLEREQACLSRSAAPQQIWMKNLWVCLNKLALTRFAGVGGGWGTAPLFS